MTNAHNERVEVGISFAITDRPYRPNKLHEDLSLSVNAAEVEGIFSVRSPLAVELPSCKLQID